MYNKIVNKLRNALVNHSNPKYDMMLEKIRKYVGSLDGKIVLDVGSDSAGVFITEIKNKLNPKEITGINPVIKSNVEIFPNGKLLKESANSIPFENDYFDHVFSLAAFEHFHDLPNALDEIYRVLKKGGTLVSVFGPIWSSYIGHHLWTYVDGQEVSYRNTFLPPFCHLLMSKKELYDYCVVLYGIKKTTAIVDYVYDSKDQNRLFFSDYLEIFNNSKFDCNIIFGLPNMPFSEKYGLIDYSELCKNLKKSYPNKDGFSYGTIEIVLQK